MAGRLRRGGGTMSRQSAQRPDVDRELSGLKDFQRRTVDHVDDRLWGDDPTRRFLVADEVGLGKTLVARGVIAKAIDRLWDDIERIDVVYICSNAQIARQNLARLRVGDEAGHDFADRLTLLARRIDELEGRKLNFVSFSPGTSFNVGDSGGKAEERVLLYWMLRSQLPQLASEYWLKFFCGGTRLENFRNQVGWFDRSTVPHAMSTALVAELRETPGGDGQANLLDEFLACGEEFKYKREDWRPDGHLSRWRYRLIGRMRQHLARAAVAALEPDIIVLDEFQRFTSLLHDDNPGAELARALFDHGDARLLLLSATPFKMYTLPDEDVGEDHYTSFLQTLEFLAGPSRVEGMKDRLGDLRRGLMTGDRDLAEDARDAVQSELRRVVVRTERLASTPDRDGMLKEATLPGLTLAGRDLHDYRFLSRIATALGQPDMMEYWRSSPYVLELMDGYVVKKELEQAGPLSDEVRAAVKQARHLLTKRQVHAYQRLDPGNAKMRALATDVLDAGAWRMAWIPPSLPYYELSGPYAEESLRHFTKRLVFSAWNVVPKAISSVLSYEAERRLRELSGTTRSYDAARQTGLLAFARSEGRLTGMPVLALLYPCAALAQIGDPLYVAARLQQALPLNRDAVVAGVREQVEELLADLPPGRPDGPTDDAWYWAAPVLFDQRRLDLPASQAVDLQYGEEWGENDSRTVFEAHLARAAQVDPGELGRRPEDLAEVLTQMALGGLGVCALRALSRVTVGLEDVRDFDVRNYASSISWALRNLLNQPELMAVVRGAAEDGASYWKDVLTHCVNGGLTAVLDEYAHVLNESLGVAQKSDAEKASAIADEMSAAMGMRASVNKATDLRVSRGELSMESFSIRNHFAVRFGRGVTEDQAVAREGQVRQAYNSPFWPFVLSSTSVGQEGLDFHQYSHAIVHWNLPSNPVDLEQREGRVHRYKGHAVRRNIALAYGDRPEVTRADDPWKAMFDLALRDRPPAQSMIHPYWVFPQPSGYQIERYVPALPLSREAHSYRRLMRTVGAYRLVIGQPRQEDLLRYLGDNAEALADLFIDLSPSG
jgi:hypothetical protein